jgi:c-di-GMP-binding flagellar brake protein YcgR
MLMINESSLSMVEIGLNSDFKAFNIREEKRREKKEEEEGEKR